MRDVKVSIIVPVYNASEFLKDSVESIVNQTHKNLQIIFVDDGSTDNSVTILEEYKREDERISIIKQQNQYAGVARNNGLKHAIGKYILFLDADDVFEKNMVADLVDIAETNNTDIVFFGYYRFSDSLRKKRPAAILYFDNAVTSAKQLADKAFQVSFGVPWNKMFNRNFILSSGIEFQNLKNNNDEFFAKMTFLLADRVYFSNKRYVNYRINNKNSLQGSVNSSNDNFAKAIIAIYNEMIQRGIYEKYKDSFVIYALNLSMEALDRCDTFQSYQSVFMVISNVLFPTIHIDSYCLSDISIEKKAILESIIECDLDKTLFNLYVSQKTTLISKCSIEYRIGHKVLHALRLR